MLIASAVDSGSHTLTTERFRRRLNTNTLVTSVRKDACLYFQTRPVLPCSQLSFQERHLPTNKRTRRFLFPGEITWRWPIMITLAVWGNTSRFITRSILPCDHCPAPCLSSFHHASMKKRSPRLQSTASSSTVTCIDWRR